MYTLPFQARFHSHLAHESPRVQWSTESDTTRVPCSFWQVFSMSSSPTYVLGPTAIKRVELARDDVLHRRPDSRKLTKPLEKRSTCS